MKKEGGMLFVLVRWQSKPYEHACASEASAQNFDIFGKGYPTKIGWASTAQRRRKGQPAHFYCFGPRSSSDKMDKKM